MLIVKTEDVMSLTEDEQVELVKACLEDMSSEARVETVWQALSFEEIDTLSEMEEEEEDDEEEVGKAGVQHPSHDE